MGLFMEEEEIRKIRETYPEVEEFYQLAELYKVMSDPSRLRIIFALRKREMCVNDLAKLLNVSQSSVSHALANFRTLNLVRFRKENNCTLYSLSDEHVEMIFAMGLEHIEER